MSGRRSKRPSWAAVVLRIPIFIIYFSSLSPIRLETQPPGRFDLREAWGITLSPFSRLAAKADESRLFLPKRIFLKKTRPSGVFSSGAWRNAPRVRLGS
jgi:hypothetical protein